MEALSGVRDSLLEIKARLLDEIVAELRTFALNKSDSETEPGSTALHRRRTSTGVNANGVAAVGAIAIETKRLQTTAVAMGAGDDEEADMSLPSLLQKLPKCVGVEEGGAQWIDEKDRAAQGMRGIGAMDRRELHSAAAFAGTFSWTLNLSDASDEMEASLPDPSAAGLLYCRLLVRAVVLLRAEKDAERMLMESFLEQYLKRVSGVRGAAVVKSSRYSRDSVQSKKVMLFYARGLLREALSLLRKLIYILKLFEVSVGGTRDSRASEGHTYRRRFLLPLWKEIEEVLSKEFLRHFSDREGHPDREMGSQSVKTSGHSYKDSRGRGDEWDDLETTSARKAEEGLLICRPSGELAVPLHKHVAEFSECATDLLQDGSEGTEFESSTLLSAVQKFVETELLPAMQSQANEVLRYSIGSQSHFLSGSSTGVLWAYDEDTNEQSSKQPLHVAAEVSADELDAANPPVCLAASSIASLFGPVAAYWIHLPAHRLHFGVIFDRVLRGFVAAAKEELRALHSRVSSSMLGATTSVKMAVIASLQEDPLYLAYRLSAFELVIGPPHR